MYVQMTKADMQDYVLDSEQRRILNAHSKGGPIGRQFSPLVARLKSGHTLEYAYHSPEVGLDGKHIPPRNGSTRVKVVNYRFRSGEYSYSLKHEWHYALYCLWFEENPRMLDVLKQYAGARDFFDKQGGEHYVFGNVPMQVEPTARCCQGRSLAWYVQQRPMSDELAVILQDYRIRYR